jgi:hemerythrin-like domain-containing protein
MMNKSLEIEDLKEFNITALKYRDLLKNHIEKENDDLW